MFNYLLMRLREASTWRGLILTIAGATGLSLEPSTIELVISVGVTLAGVLGAATKDRR